MSDGSQIDNLSLEQLLRLHLSCDPSASSWTIHDSHVHGQGLFASRDIEQGEVIFKDVALVLGPRAGTSCPPVCVGCLSSSHSLSPCPSLCGLPVCSPACQNSPQHQAECHFLREHCREASEGEVNGNDVRGSLSGATEEVQGNGDSASTALEDPNGIAEDIRSETAADVNGTVIREKTATNQTKITPVVNGNEASSHPVTDTVKDQQAVSLAEVGTNESDSQSKTTGDINGNTSHWDGTKAFAESKQNSEISQKTVHKSASEEIKTVALERGKEKAVDNGNSMTMVSADEKEVARINVDLIRAVTPIRCLWMSKVKRKIMRALEARHFQICEVDLLKRHLHRPLSSSEEAYLRFCCGVLDTNAYGGSGQDNTCLNFRGLYALSAVMNHSCHPNTTYWFDADQRMVVKAARRIAGGEEILSTYSSLLWSTASRRSFLRGTKGFECRCARCKDPAEFGSNLSAIFCKTKPCPGILLPSNPLDITSPWLCSSQHTKHQLDPRKAFQMVNICSKVAQMLTESEDLQQIGTFLKSVPENSQTAVQIRKHFVLHSQGEIMDISNEKLLFKEQSCHKLLDLMTTLKLGANYLRGLILQELFRVLEEKSRRFPNVPLTQSQEVLDDIRREYEVILSF